MEKPLKIAVVVKSFTMTGGMEKYAVEVALRLRDRGHQIDVYTREADKNCCDGIEIYPLPLRYKFSSILSTMALASDCDKVLQSKEYDVIHSHERGYHQDVLTNHCFSYKGSISGLPWLRRLDYMLLSFRTWMYFYLESRQMQTRYLVGVSGAIKNDIYDHYQRCDVKVITPGVDCEKFHPERVLLKRQQVRKSLGVTDTEKMVLFVGSEFKRKGLDDLLPVAQQKGVRLVIVGRGEKISQYRKKVKAFGISGKVHFTGLVDTVEEYYAAADLVALPSTSEAFGMSILEAMACGLPVLVSGNSGVAALIEDGKNGFIIKNQARTAHEVAWLLRDIDKNLIGKQARKTAEKFDWDSIATQYELLFYKIRKHKNDYSKLNK